MSSPLPELPPGYREPILNLWAFLARDGSDGRFRDSEFAQFGQMGMHPSVIRALLVWLCENAWMRAHAENSQTGSGLIYEFTTAGTELTLGFAQAGEDAPITAGREARVAAADAAEALARIAGQSNQLAADHPERLPMYRASIEAGAGLLRHHAPTHAVVRATLIESAQWFLRQATTAAVRLAADDAIRHFTGLL